MSRSEILINKLFMGKYLEMGENIGHEIINLFKADNGNHYVYVTKSGVVQPYHDVEAINFIEHDTDRTAEVVALAKGLTRADFGKTSFDSIRYGGVALPQIFHDNKWYQEQDDYTNITYQAEEVLFPKVGKGERMLISLDDAQGDENVVSLNVENRKKIVGQSIRWYASEQTCPEAYAQLSILIADPERWEKDTSPTLLESFEGPGEMEPSFLEVIGKENDELVFSNLLAHYFEYSQEAFKKFAKDVLGIEDMDSYHHVLREHNHIDILIESPRYAIVIENKIGSGINGCRRDDINQLDVYKEKTADETKSEKVECFLFYPDYRDGELRKEAEGKGYIPVRYSEVLDFFEKSALSFAQDKHFPEFLRGLERHSVSTTAELTFKTMKARFLYRIQNVRP